MIFYFKWTKFWPVFFYFVFISFLAVIILPEFIGEGLRLLKKPAAVHIQNDISAPLFLSDFDDPVLRAWNDTECREFVISFFEKITGSEELASTILINAAHFNVAPSLVFSLCREESRFNARAVNKANSNHTIDRGLFQLNSASFPLTEEEFFDPAINTYYGVSHLKYCLDAAGTEVAGLAMYNAGASRVKSGGTPKMTLDYISRIMKYQRYIEDHFAEEYAKQLVEIAAVTQDKNLTGFKESVFNLSLLSPLGN